jgi:hypothetical protein
MAARSISRRNIPFMAALLILLSMSQSFATPYKVGDTVINFKLRDLNGKFVMLSQFAGKIIVLNFFATW